MTLAYLDCVSGASGDMLLGALLAAGASRDAVDDAFAKLRIPGLRLEVVPVMRGAIAAQHARVLADDDRSERHLSDILQLIEESQLPAAIRSRAAAIFSRIGSCEAAIHGTDPATVHLHELGGVDTIADVVGVLVAITSLEVGEVHCSPLPLARGTTRSQHGQIPLPAPATLELLKDVPVEGRETGGELVTPTGAALVTDMASHFGEMPPMSVARIGYGAGSRDWPIPNVLRVMVGSSSAVAGVEVERLVQLETNVDDLNPEFYDYVQERLFAAGALDVALQPLQMKKNRPGLLVRVLCRPEAEAALTELLFRETSTLGVRRHELTRRALARRSVTVATAYGSVGVKIAATPGAPGRPAPEYDDCAALARSHGVPLHEVYRAAVRAAEEDLT